MLIVRASAFTESCQCIAIKVRVLRARRNTQLTAIQFELSSWTGELTSSSVGIGIVRSDAFLYTLEALSLGE